MEIDTGLFIVGTPIGNLEDISIRAINTLKEVDVILAEDTRHTKKLTSKYEIKTRLISYHKFNAAKKSNQIMEHLKNGKSIAIVSDSGMPNISDPGGRIIDLCRDENIKITTIPGPTALTSAISMTGFYKNGFIFSGFLPHKSGGRKKELIRWSDSNKPIIFYESPYRLLKLLNEIKEYLGEETKVFVFRELTKKFEETLIGTPSEISNSFQKRTVKGEIVVIIMPKK